MEYDLRDFRQAARLLEGRPAWSELQGVMGEITREDVLDVYEEETQRRATQGARARAGGQAAINHVFRQKLGAVGGWVLEPPLFATPGESARGWKMDFLKQVVGVEVSFNHAEAIPWTFTRLNIAGESDDVIPANRIEVGVAIFAKQSMKEWARMDNAVGTFERAWDWLQIMRPIMPVPILVVGLNAAGWEDGLFRGTDRGTRTNL
jgi:hypothetical protein